MRLLITGPPTLASTNMVPTPLSPHLLDLLHFLKDVGSDHGDHHLDSGQDRQDGHPDDLVVLEPVQQVVHTGGLLHPPGRVLILLPANKKSINDLLIMLSTVQPVVYPHESQGFSKPKEIVIKREIMSLSDTFLSSREQCFDWPLVEGRGQCFV